MDGTQLDFFLGGLSPSGYAGYYSRAAQDEHGVTVLLKGGPGCGKSTLLKRVAAHLLAQGETVEAIHCAADPDSLDGVICPARHFTVLDATAPHALEPEYPAAAQDVITLYNALNRPALQARRTEVVELFDRCKALQERATRYITAAGSLLQDSQRIAAACTDTQKAEAFAEVLATRYLPRSGRKGAESVRLLSASTLHGRMVFADTLPRAAHTPVVMEDPYGAASKVLLRALRRRVLERGYRCITCYCSMSPFDKIEHLILPDIGVAFATANGCHRLHFEGQRTLHYTRFTAGAMLKPRRERLQFNRRACNELLAQAAAAQSEAKHCHDALEKIYTENFDFAALDTAFAQLLRYMQ